MNMNDVAQEISKLEGKKKELSIAQIKEVLSCLKNLVLRDHSAMVTVMKYLWGKK